MNSHVKKLMAVAATVAAAGALQVIPTGIAQAYTPVITGEAVCQENGDIQVNWLYTPGAGVENIQITSPSGMAGPVSGPVSFTETYPAGSTSATLTVLATYSWLGGTEVQVADPATATIPLPGDACTPPPPGGAWCSPGYWRQPHHLDSWVGYSPNDLYNAIFDPDLPNNPTLLQVLQSPQTYNRGTDSFNKVGDLLSAAHPDVDFDGIRVEDSCPLN